MKTVGEIVKEYLIEHGHNGLAGDDCGCTLDDLMPCDGSCGDCVPAKKKIIDGGYYMQEVDDG